MHILFVHQNFPAQFGHIAEHLARMGKYRCTFVTQRAEGMVGSIACVRYETKGGATASTHYCSRTFENATWHAHGVYQALKARPDIRPDLIVGHSGFGSTIFLRELHDVPIINYFEYFYRARGSDMDFRPDFPSSEMNRLRARTRNAMILLDLDNCDAAYSPTRWQRDRLPGEYREKVQPIFDGIDTRIWRPAEKRPPVRLGQVVFPEGKRIVTYATRGMESMRGFDIFMRMAGRLCELREDVHFVIAGQDRVCYGGDESFTGGKSFKEWVISRGNYDLSRFHFVGLLPPTELARLFQFSDLHVYLTVPFVLSWSLLNAMACGATVLASGTEPVREFVRDGENGLLCDFFDVEGMARRASEVLDDPAAFRELGQRAAEEMREQYSLEVCLPRMLELYQQASNQQRGRG